MPPVPACSTMTTTAYRGSFTGANDANHDVSCLPVTSAVPVLPPTGTVPYGKPRNAPRAVPSVGTAARALRM